MATLKKNGQVLARDWKSGRGFALRFMAYGERRYVTLGTEREGWTRAKAQIELENILADVRRGIWIPSDRTRKKIDSSPEPDAVVRFHEFASKHVEARRLEVSERMHEFETWALAQHLLPYFAHWPVADIDIEAVDDYRGHKVRQAVERREAIEKGTPLRDAGGRLLEPLSASSINKTIDVLQSILAVAVERHLLDKNPAAGRRRRLKKQAKRPVHLDNVHQIEALLDAAGQLDREPYWRMDDRRANVAMLVLGGPRAIELTCARWRDIDLALARMGVGRSKTEAGLREIHLVPLLRDELAAHKARSRRTGPDDLAFPNGRGGRRSVANLRDRVLEPVLIRADELLAARGQSRCRWA